jgi:hypothetical protein
MNAHRHRNRSNHSSRLRSLYRRAALDLLCLAQLGSDDTLIDLCRDSLSLLGAEPETETSTHLAQGMFLLLGHLDSDHLGLSSHERAQVRFGLTQIAKAIKSSTPDPRSPSAHDDALPEVD